MVRKSLSLHPFVVKYLSKNKKGELVIALWFLLVTIRKTFELKQRNYTILNFIDI